MFSSDVRLSGFTITGNMGPKGKAAGDGKGKNAPPQPAKGKKGAPPNQTGGKKKGEKGPPTDGSTAGPVPSKAARKNEREEREKQRIADREDIMNGMPSYDSEEEDYGNFHVEFPGVSKKKAKDLTTDKFGNTVSKSKLAEDKRVEEMRAAARARRAAKEEEKQKQEQKQVQESDTVKSSPSTNKSGVGSVADLERKLAQGLKLSHKEKKALKSQSRSDSELKEMHYSDPHLASFSLSLQPQRGVERMESQPDTDPASSSYAEWQTSSATDIIVPCFTMSAPGKHLLLDASLRLVTGRRYGVLGSNGCGKSTLLHFLAARRLPIPNGMDVLLVQQEVLASKIPIYQQVLQADAQRMLYSKQLLELEEQFHLQDILSAEGHEHGDADKEKVVGGQQWSEEEWERNLERYVKVGQQWEASGADSGEAMVRRILTGLGFSLAMQEEGSERLSGGWRMRVSLATALFMEPKLLLLDEPTNHLDLNAVLWLDDYLCNHWSKQSTVLVVSHDADFLDSVCTDILHLDNQCVTSYRGDFSFFEGMRGKILAKKEKEYQLQIKTVKEFVKGSQMSQEKAEKKTLQKLNLSQLMEKPKEYRVNFVLHAADDDSPAIDMLDVSFGYSEKKDKCLFQNIRLKIDNHSRVAIVGPNGAGKSTLLRLLRGTLEPTVGEVIRHHHLRIGWYDQHFESLLPFESTPVAFLCETCGVDKLEARKYLGMFGLDGSRHLIKIGQLSGGQKSRVILASISLQRPNILILDEPTNHLDMESVDALIRAIKLFEGGVVLVSHDARLIASTECEIWVVGDAPSGLRVEKQGFTKYRKDVMAAIAREEALAERVAAQSALRQKARRMERVQAAAKRCRLQVANTLTTPTVSKEDSKVSSIFRKDSAN